MNGREQVVSNFTLSSYIWNKQVGHFSSKDLLLVIMNERRRWWDPTPVLLPGKYMDGGVWCATVHGIMKSQTRLGDLTFTFHFHALEKEMATHSSVLVWRIPGMGEPGVLPSMWSHRVGHDWSNLAAAAALRMRGFCMNSTVTSDRS